MEESREFIGTEEYVRDLFNAKKYYEHQLNRHLLSRSEYGKNAHENHQTGVFDAERERLEGIIVDLSDALSRIKIVDKEQSKEGEIVFDDIVTVQIGDDRIMRVQITGGMPNVTEDQDLVKITRNSPMGAAIFGKHVGDTVTYQVPDPSKRGNKKTLTLTILSKEEVVEKDKNKPKQPGEDE